MCCCCLKNAIILNYIGLQNPAWLQPEDFQQPGVCLPPLTVRQPRVRGSLPVNQVIHYENVNSGLLLLVFLYLLFSGWIALKGA